MNKQGNTYTLIYTAVMVIVVAFILAFAAGQEPDELRAEIAGLRDQLRLLAELERLDIRNIL